MINLDRLISRIKRIVLKELDRLIEHFAWSWIISLFGYFTELESTQ